MFWKELYIVVFAVTLIFFISHHERPLYIVIINLKLRHIEVYNLKINSKSFIFSSLIKWYLN
jgi:hypothetical protein